MDPDELLKTISSILEELDIPHVITGGFAISVWGQPRFTADIDVVVELVKKNIKPLAKKLLAIDKNVYVDEETMQDALVRESEFNFIHPDTGLKVDFFVTGGGIYDKLKIKRAIAKEMFGQKINFVSPEDLILSKLMWGRESDSFKQWADIKTVLKNKNLKLNMKYIAQWADRHNTLHILNRLLEEIKND